MYRKRKRPQAPKKKKGNRVGHIHKKIYSFAFRDNFGRVIYINELIFPIIAIGGDGNYRPVGSGFFVHPAGGFVTANHVLFRNGQLQDCYAIHTVSPTEKLVRKIQAFFPHPEADIGIGMLKGQLLGLDGKVHLRASFPISRRVAAVGNVIRSYAYPNSVVQVTDGTQIGSFQGSWCHGRITKYLKEGEHWALQSDCFETNMEIASGASGGPVIRGMGIIGVNSRGWEFLEGETEGDPISWITPISKIFDLEISDSDGRETTVLELMRDGHMAFINQ